MTKKRKDPAKRRRRMGRRARLGDARTWLPAQKGMEVVELLEAYQRWYGVDRLCAIIELRRLGGPISEEYEAQARNAVVQSGKAGSTERAAKRAEKQRAKQQRAAAKRAEKQRAAGTPAARDRPYEAADSLEWTSWAEMGIDAECRAAEDSMPDRSGEDAERSIEDVLFDDARAVDLRVIETTIQTEIEIKATIETEIEIETKITTEIETTTKVETKTTIETKRESELKRRDGGRVRVRILLEADPEVLAKRAWGLIFAISAFSFADADADLDVVDYYEWSPDDMLRCLAFDRGGCGSTLTTYTAGACRRGSRSMARARSRSRP